MKNQPISVIFVFILCKDTRIYQRSLLLITITKRLRSFKLIFYYFQLGIHNKLQHESLSQFKIILLLSSGLICSHRRGEILSNPLNLECHIPYQFSSVFIISIAYKLFISTISVIFLFNLHHIQSYYVIDHPRQAFNIHLNVSLELDN